MSFTMWFGGAGGSAQKALRKLEIPDVLISYQTKNNRPWDQIERLAVDSGGFSVLRKHDDYPTSHEAYLSYLRDHEERLSWFALRDYPVAEDLLEEHDRTAREHQQLTTNAHREILDILAENPIDADATAVIQGRTPDGYRQHIDELRAANVIRDSDRVGVGSLVGREPEHVAEILRTVREELPNQHIHGFGVSRNDLVIPEIRQHIDSADSCSYEPEASREAPDGIPCDFRHVAGYLARYRTRIIKLQRADSLAPDGGMGEPGTTRLTDF